MIIIIGNLRDQGSIRFRAHFHSYIVNWMFEMEIRRKETEPSYNILHWIVDCDRLHLLCTWCTKLLTLALSLRCETCKIFRYEEVAEMVWTTVLLHWQYIGWNGLVAITVTQCNDKTYGIAVTIEF